MDLGNKIRHPWHGCQNCDACFLDKRYGRDTNCDVLSADRTGRAHALKLP